MYLLIMIWLYVVQYVGEAKELPLNYKSIYKEINQVAVDHL